MKFMMNGALTVGTRDGADDRDGRGGRRGELLPVRPDRRAGGGQPRLVQPACGTTSNEPETRAGPGPDLRRPLQPATSRASSSPIRETLLTRGDYYMHLADLTAYVQAQERVGELYARPDALGAQGDPQRRRAPASSPATAPSENTPARFGIPPPAPSPNNRARSQPNDRSRSRSRSRPRAPPR